MMGNNRKNRFEDVFKRGVEGFEAVRISIASPEDIRNWSSGKVELSETLDYRTFKPKEGGLFCEKIFGPEKDYRCACGRYKDKRFEGQICEHCGVEVTTSRVRRERMGHIELTAPVAHIWYVKNGIISALLGITQRDLEEVLHFAKYIVLDPGNILNKMQLLTEEEYRELREKYGEVFRVGRGAEAIRELLREIDLDKLAMELDLEMKEAEQKGDKQKAARLAKRLHIVESFRRSKPERLVDLLTGKEDPKRKKEGYIKPEWMILEVIPVLPPELRPMLKLEGGRIARADLNDLYRRLINRNKRLKKHLQNNAPDPIIANEKRLLQEAVDALIDNARLTRPVVGNNNRRLKSLTDLLGGKQGRFRRNLLGKRVDYSGRSVIVIGPKLKIHQCGLPQEMVLELFKPFIIHHLVNKTGKARSVPKADEMIRKADPQIMPIVSQIIKKHPVLLNRAPTLHRPSIQAFEPIMVKGKAIKIPALVCTAFNADFDGDQMAVHVPLLHESVAEASYLIQANYQIFSPAHGKPLATPTQDMTLGCYYLTRMLTSKEVEEIDITNFHANPRLLRRSADVYRLPSGEIILQSGEELTQDKVEQLKKAGITKVKIYKQKIFSTEEELMVAYENGKVSLHEAVYVRVREGEDNKLSDKYITTCVGRVIFNQLLPAGLRFMNTLMTKGELNSLVVKCHKKYGLDRTVKLLDDIKELGFKWATISGTSFSIEELRIPPAKAQIIKEAEERTKRNREQFEKKAITADERRQNDIDTWIHVTEQVTDEMIQIFKKEEEEGKYNSIYAMAFSGARGNIQQVRQLAAMRGLMSNPKGEIMDYPIKSNFKEGLKMFEYFISTYGARKGVVDTALRTADSGYLTRELVDVAQDVVITADDCGDTSGFEVHPLREMRTVQNMHIDEVMIPLEERIYGRYLARDVVHPKTGEVIVKAGTLLLEEECDLIKRAEVEMEVTPQIIGKVTATVVQDADERIVVAADKVITEHLYKILVARGIKKIRVRPRVFIRSPITCKMRYGMCRKCYGLDLSTHREVALGEAVGIIAAQSIGEPGTQLTMRTFHTGGVAEARRVQVKAPTSGTVILDYLRWEYKTEKKSVLTEDYSYEGEDDNAVAIKSDEGLEEDTRRIVREGYILIEREDGTREKCDVPPGAVLERNLKNGIKVRAGDTLAEYNPNQVVSKIKGVVSFANIGEKDGKPSEVVLTRYGRVIVSDGDKMEEYHVPKGYYLRVTEGKEVTPGDILAEKIGEKEPAIASYGGKVYLHNVKVHGGQVINDEGILYVFDKENEEEVVYKLPTGVRETADANSEYELAVKNGSEVAYGSDMLYVKSEIAGYVESISDKQIVIKNRVKREYLLPKEQGIEFEEKDGKKYFWVKAKNGGIVKIKKETVDKHQHQRVVVTKSEEFKIPEDIKLFVSELKVKQGKNVKKGKELTGEVKIVSEIDGEVEVVDTTIPADEAMIGKIDGLSPEELKQYKVKAYKVIVRDISKEPVNTSKNIGKELIGKKVWEDIISKDGKVLLKKGEKFTEEFVRTHFVPVDANGIIRKVEEEPLNLKEVDLESYVGTVIEGDVIDPKTGEILAEKGDVLDDDLVDLLRESNVEEIVVRGRGVAVISEKEVDLREVSADREMALEQLQGEITSEDIIDPETGEVLVPKGTIITIAIVDELLKRANSIGKVKVYRKYRYKIPEGAELKFEEGKEVKKGTELVKALHFANDQIVWVEEEVSYVIPSRLKGMGRPCVLRVKTGDRVSRGDDIIEPLPPYKAPIDGKVNYKVKTDERTGEEVVVSLEVYDTQDYRIPAEIKLLVKEGDMVEVGDPITEKVEYENIEETKDVYKIFKETDETKYHKITPDMEILVKEGDRVREGDRLAVLKNTKVEQYVTYQEDGETDQVGCYTCFWPHLRPAALEVKVGSGKWKKIAHAMSEVVSKGEKWFVGKKISAKDLKIGDEIYRIGTVIDEKLAKLIVENKSKIDDDVVFVENGWDVDWSLGVVRVPDKKKVKLSLKYDYENRMVVILDKKTTTVSRIILRKGEAFPITEGARLQVKEGEIVERGEILAKWAVATKKTTDIVQGLPRVRDLFRAQRPKKEAVIAPITGVVRKSGVTTATLHIEDENGNTYPIKASLSQLAEAIVFDGEYVEKGDQLTEGHIELKKLRNEGGVYKVQRYLNDEIQRVYRGQGVRINDKHIEIIISRMFKRVLIKDPGDTRFVKGEEVTLTEFLEENDRVKLLYGDKARLAKGRLMVVGIEKAALTTDSFISAASFQETARVLTRAAIRGKLDFLRGLKENVILAKLIPAGTGFRWFRDVDWPPLGEKKREDDASTKKVEVSADA